MRASRPRAVGLVVGLMLTALFATAVGASAQSAPVPTRAATTAATPLLSDINGTYSDGGSARPVISNVNDILTVDMSSQRRPTATGIVINSDTILVTFPDDTTYTAKLQAPSTIRWSNGSTWQKTTLVPDVRGNSVSGARSILNSSGFVVGTVTHSSTGRATTSELSAGRIREPARRPSREPQ